MNDIDLFMQKALLLSSWPSILILPTIDSFEVTLANRFVVLSYEEKINGLVGRTFRDFKTILCYVKSWDFRVIISI